MNNILEQRLTENDELRRGDQQWYQFAMVWMVIALPLLVVIASIVTVTIAHQHAPQVIQQAAE